MTGDFEYIGSEAKYLVTLSSPGFSMADDQFEIILKRGSNELTFAKATSFSVTGITTCASTPPTSARAMWSPSRRLMSPTQTSRTDSGRRCSRLNSLKSGWSDDGMPYRHIRARKRDGGNLREKGRDGCLVLQGLRCPVHEAEAL